MSFVLPQGNLPGQRFLETDHDMHLPVKPFSSAQRSESASTSSTSISESSSSSSSSTSSSLSTDTKAYDYAQLERLVRAIGYDGLDDHVTMESVSAEMAFCNSVYRMQITECDDETKKTYFAKLFRPLALGRMTSLPLGTVDRLVASHGLAPAPLAQTETAILFDECCGRTLSERDCHGRLNVGDCQAVGKALGLLHSIAIPCSSTKSVDATPLSENILWKACESMLSLCHADYSYKGWTLSKLRQIVKDEQTKLETLQLPTVSCGHGDCKPNNIFVLDSSEDTADTDATMVVKARFIDLELAGIHYRAFDLAKFFRTDSPTEFTKPNQQAFYQAYLQHYKNATASSPEATTAIQDLEREVSYLLPMTWLEAAIFFVCMACQDEGQADRWNTLAVQRLESYEASVVQEEPSNN